MRRGFSLAQLLPSFSHSSLNKAVLPPKSENMRTARCTFPVLALLAGAVALAQVPDPQTTESDLGDLITDRPGFGTPANVLPVGVLQLESGFAFTSQTGHGASMRTFTLGSPSLRAGIGKRIELRFSGDGFVDSRTTTCALLGRSEGWSDFGVGAKIGLLDEHSWWPALSAMPVLSLPIGGRSITNSAYDPGLALDWSKSLPEKWSSWGTLGYTSVASGTGRYAQRLLAVAFAHSVWKGLGGYVETYNLSPTGSNSAPAWLLDGGLFHALGRNGQIDVETGRRFVGSSASWFTSIGFVARFGKVTHLVSPFIR